MRVVNIIVRAVLAAVAFVTAVVVVPDIAFLGGTVLSWTALVLITVGLSIGVLPVVLARVAGPIRPWAVGVAAVLLAAAWIAALAIVGSFTGWGIALAAVPNRPIDALLAFTLVAVLAALPMLLELAVVARPIDRRSIASRRPHLDRRSVVLGIFLLSGASGLIYEVVWSRQLVLVFGNTTQAVSAILTGYFGGLAIGAVIGGRLADRVRSALRLYGILELALVGVVLVTPLLFRGMHEIYRGWYDALESQPTTLALIRYLLALIALAPATVLMGATLPSLSRHLTRSAAEFGGSFGRLYAVNTVGAVAGTLLAGLVLIEVVGLSGTLLIGAAGSAAAGIGALVVDRQRPTPASLEAEIRRESEPPAETTRTPGTGPDVRRLALVVAFVSGLTSLGYQVLWTRLLASGSGNRTYVFTLILATFLVGLALGAAYVAARTTKAQTALARLGAAQLAVALIALAGMPVLAADLISGWPLVFRIAIVVLPGALALGVTLPLVSSLIAPGQDRVGKDAGILLASNTFGAICGTFLIPFVAIPIIGSPRSLVLLALINALLGITLLVRELDLDARTRKSAVAIGVVVSLVAALGFVVPNRFVVDPGLNRMGRTGAVFASTEDEIASVQAGNIRGPRLWVGGNGMTALTVDAKLMPLMPEFVRPAATRMLVICFGMGSSFRTGLRSGLSVDGVELVPSVPAMFGRFYADAAQVRADPRGRVIVADGRNYVELSDRTYDIVVVDPPPPVESSGTAVLYSQEFYRAAASRLTEQGVMMEWMPKSQSVDEFRAHVRTFQSVFPNVRLAFGPSTHGVYMLGSAGSLAIEPAAIAAVLGRPGVVADLDEAYDAPVSTLEEWQGFIPTMLWLEGADVAAFAGQGPLITDDHPLTEYFLLRHAFGPASPPMTVKNLLATAKR
jgi:spermidine synthase